MKKGYSQRKVARLINIHHSIYNELEKGNIKKSDIDMLKNLSEVLEISLELLLTTAGYNNILDSFKDKSHNKTPNTTPAIAKPLLFFFTKLYLKFINIFFRIVNKF